MERGMPQSNNELRNAFADVARSFFLSKNIVQKIRFFADSYNSFEGWLNWELAFAFSSEYPWPGYTAHRECRYKNGGLADIAIYTGGDYSVAKSKCHLETKVVWDNHNAGKGIQSIARDEERLSLCEAGLLLVVAISAQQMPPNEELSLKARSSDYLLAQVEAVLSSATRRNRQFLLEDDVKPSPRYYLAPSIRMALYHVG